MTREDFPKLQEKCAQRVWDGACTRGTGIAKGKKHSSGQEMGM